jgi:hypothetical protein
MVIGIATGALGQHAVASRNLDVEVVAIAETMIARLRSLKGEGLPRP